VRFAHPTGVIAVGTPFRIGVALLPPARVSSRMEGDWNILLFIGIAFVVTAASAWVALRR
jgi:hypothetical protein